MILKIINILDGHFPHLALRLRYLKNLILNHEEIKTYKELVSKGDIVLDIGARKGLFTYLFLNLVGETGLVFCFEPLSANVSCLNKLFKKYTQVTIFPIALANENSKSVIYTPVENGELNTALSTMTKKDASVQTHVETIQVRRGDDIPEIRNSQINFIKIDVEGAEQAVLEGLETVILSCLPKIFIEIEDRHRELPPIYTLNWLRQRGYKIETQDEDDDLSISPSTGHGLKRTHNMYLFTRSK